MIERIHASSWLRSPKYITSLSRKSDGNHLLEALFPDDAETIAILAYFRQLHASDRLLSKACTAYVQHSGDQRKRIWIDERRQTFDGLVDSSPTTYGIKDKSRREIIRMFMYGAGLLHSSSSHGDDVALKEFISRHEKHGALMIFNSCLMDFFQVAATIHPVIRQDYLHWINNDGFAAADRVTIPDLFREFRSPPHGI